MGFMSSGQVTYSVTSPLWRLEKMDEVFGEVVGLFKAVLEDLVNFIFRILK